MNIGDLFDVGDSGEVRTVAAALAGIERDLHAAVQDHYEALGIDPPPDRTPSEERVDQLARLVERYAADDLWGYWVDEHAPDRLENPAAAREYAGADGEAWAAAVAEWAAAAPADAGDERDRADAYARERFGLGLEAFESAVVEWTPERTLRRALRGPVDADIERIRVATEAIRRRREG